MQGPLRAGGVEYCIRTFTQPYPELIRIWRVQIENWRIFIRTFARDAAQFVRRIDIPGDPRLESLHPDLSDPHNGNTTVMRVGFAGGTEWFYKPRPVGQGLTLFKLLSRINREGFSHPFAIPRFVSAKEHHWMEAVQECPCTSDRQENAFWFRAGALLYLVNLLGGVDFHTGNLICSRDQPVWVDCETLLHPDTPMPEGIAAIETDLFRIGMLPLEGRVGLNVSAFGPMTLSRVQKSRRGESQKSVFMVVDGFGAMHELLGEKSKRAAMVNNAAAELRAGRCRILYRPTAHYHEILQRSLSPHLLANTVRRQTFLREACDTSFLGKTISLIEAAALKNLDIPLFFGCCAQPAELLTNRELESAQRQIERSLVNYYDLPANGLHERESVREV
jgi:lantibiotic modifying enzyme